MGLLEVNRQSAPYRPMVLTSTPGRANQILIGHALRAMREDRGMAQREIAQPLDITTQAWQKYEAGEREFKADRLSAVLRVLEATPEQLELEKARILGAPTPRGSAGVESSDQPFVIDVYGRARAGPKGAEVYDAGEPLRRIDIRQILGGNSDAMQVAGDSMVPWAEPGEIVLFDRDSYPRRGGGCVIETDDGAAYVKRYERSDGSTLFVRELYPEERTITFSLAQVRGVYAVKLRGD